MATAGKSLLSLSSSSFVEMYTGFSFGVSMAQTKSFSDFDARLKKRLYISKSAGFADLSIFAQR